MEPSQEPIDSELIRSAASGDADAFRQIVERHQAMVYRTCLRILKNEADASDATQAAFVVLHEKCRTLGSGTIIGGWLYRAAGLVSRELQRSSGRRKRREEEAASMKEATTRENADLWSAVEHELDGALAVLPRKYRDVVVLRYLQEKSTDQTAGILGVSSTVVTTRLGRALEHLRDWFGRRGTATSTGVLAVVLSQNVSAAPVPATLGPSILNATGMGAIVASISPNVSLMTKGALSKMSSIFLTVVQLTLLVGWIFSMTDWVSRGCPIPRWLHLFAGSLTAAGVALVAVLAHYQVLTFNLAIGCILVPPAAAYLGWLWVAGPDLANAPECRGGAPDKH